MPTLKRPFDEQSGCCTHIPKFSLPLHVHACVQSSAREFSVNSPTVTISHPEDANMIGLWGGRSG